MASSVFDRATTNILSKKIPFEVQYDTDKKGKKTNPHIDVPEFSLGGLQWKLVARKVKDKPLCCGIWMELSEASKQELADGYEVRVDPDELEYDEVDVVEYMRQVVLPHEQCPMIKLKGSNVLYELLVKIKLKDIHPFRLQFVDEAVARTKKFDCKIILEDDEDKIVFVNKTLLSLNSSFFDAMFFGESKKKNQEAVKLSGVTEVDFLEYVYYVYSPNRPIAFNRLVALLQLGRRFENKGLLAAIDKFFSETLSSKKSCRALTSVDPRYRKPTLFTPIAKSLEKTEDIMDFFIDKAVEEPTFGWLFVQLFIQHLKAEDETKCDLREWIISRVQKVFEREFAVEKTMDPEKNVDDHSDKSMRHKIGIVILFYRLIGCLYENEFLTVQDVSLYIMDLVSKERKNSAAVEASITCLALLLEMIGRRYDFFARVASRDPNQGKQRPVRMTMVFYHLYNIKNRASDRLKRTIMKLDNLRQRGWVLAKKSEVTSMKIEENRRKAEADIECQRQEMAERAEFVDEELAKKKNYDCKIVFEDDEDKIIEMARRDEFLAEDVAKTKKYDCKLVLKDDEDKIVFVNKTILAINSPFFDVLFFGDFQEKDQDSVKLGDVKQEEFLEYLYCVYSPNRPFAVKRLEVLQRLADRFLNDDLLNAIEVFPGETKTLPVEEKQTLVETFVAESLR